MPPRVVHRTPLPPFLRAFGAGSELLAVLVAHVYVHGYGQTRANDTKFINDVAAVMLACKDMVSGFEGEQENREPAVPHPAEMRAMEASRCQVAPDEWVQVLSMADAFPNGFVYQVNALQERMYQRAHRDGK